MTPPTGPARPERRPRRQPRRRFVAVAVVALVAAGGWWTFLRAGDPFASGTRAFNSNGVTLSYPAGWLVNQALPASSGLGSTFAIIGTQPWGPCLPLDLNCHLEQRLEPSQISVSLGLGILGGDTVCDIARDRHDLADRGPGDPPATGHLLRVDGRPTLQTDYAVNGLDYYRSDEWRHWVIAAPGSTQSVYRIEAMDRGPGTDRFRAQLDALVASIRFTLPPEAGDGPADCGSPFP